MSVFLPALAPRGPSAGALFNFRGESLNPSDDRVNFFPELPVRGPVSPRWLVHSGDAPAMTHTGAVDPVDASKRAILDREGERGFGTEVERKLHFR
jgi:hypothetical protein